MCTVLIRNVSEVIGNIIAFLSNNLEAFMRKLRHEMTDIFVSILRNFLWNVHLVRDISKLEWLQVSKIIKIEKLFLGSSCDVKLYFYTIEIKIVYNDRLEQKADD